MPCCGFPASVCWRRHGSVRTFEFELVLRDVLTCSGAGPPSSRAPVGAAGGVIRVEATIARKEARAVCGSTHLVL